MNNTHLLTSLLPSQVSVVADFYSSYLQFKKADFHCDYLGMLSIKSVETTELAVALGNNVKGFNQAEWDKHKHKYAEMAALVKFGDNGLTVVRPQGGGAMTLYRLLLNTGDKELVYADPHDTDWSCGFTAADAPFYKAYWKPNDLGRALMEVRDSMADEIQLGIEFPPLMWRVSPEDKAVQVEDELSFYVEEEEEEDSAESN